jgi:hypothetical protein
MEMECPDKVVGHDDAPGLQSLEPRHKRPRSALKAVSYEAIIETVRGSGWAGPRIDAPTLCCGGGTLKNMSSRRCYLNRFRIVE